MEIETNYVLIKKNNKIYEKICDMLDDKELNMQYINDMEKIIYNIGRLINTNDFIISRTFNNKQELLGDILNNISKEDTGNFQGNTILLYANDDYMYELIHMDDLTIIQKDEDLNEFGTISNIDLCPIYYDCAIIKTSYINRTPKNELFSLECINEILKNNFYHNGLLIEPNGNIKNIVFSGDNPNLVIGDKFIRREAVEICGFYFVYYQEESNETNTTVSKLLDIDISGRIYLTILCPISNKKFWDLSEKTIFNILHIKENKESFQKINSEIMDDKLINPFLLIKKYYSIYN